ncbi:MAG: TetR family transcriptional regulator [Cyanobacteria bacterium J06554_6]
MSTPSTRDRLTQAALELFLSQGVSQTTTRQIADLAGVNEATLFRNFGNKYGLLLAMLQDAPVALSEPTQLATVEPVTALRSYASSCLQALEQFPSFVCSVIGEADHYSSEQVQVLKAQLNSIRQDMAQHLEQLLGDQARLSSEDLAGCLGALLLGYMVIEATSGYAIWEKREDFLDVLTAAFTDSPKGAPNGDGSTDAGVQDLPTAWVHQMIKQAKSLGTQDYALAIALFGAGLRPTEVTGLLRSHHISDKTQHVLQVLTPTGSRQVPVNQWILGKRYGSYTSNPLTKWLKVRKDSAPNLFATEAGMPLTVDDIQARWQQWWQGIDVGSAPPVPEQAHQTWCVEMLMRGMSLEDLSILSGHAVAALRRYEQRGREKSAIAAATQLDRKTPVGN